jgi:hypothetical protein
VDKVRDFSVINNLVSNINRKDDYKGMEELAISFYNMESKHPVLAYFSPLISEGAAFQDHKFYPSGRTGAELLSHGHAIICKWDGEKQQTGMHADTVADADTENARAGEAVGLEYTEGLREFSDAGGIVIPRDDTKALAKGHSGKIFHSAPPHRYEEVREKIIHVLKQRVTNEIQRTHAYRGGIKRQVALCQPGPAAAAKERMLTKNIPVSDTLSTQQQTFLTAIENKQPGPLFKGAYCGPEFTISEMKTLGFKCCHYAVGGTFYLIPRRSWHSVLNDRFVCTSYAWDCMYEDYNPINVPKSSSSSS